MCRFHIPKTKVMHWQGLYRCIKQPAPVGTLAIIEVLIVRVEVTITPGI